MIFFLTVACCYAYKKSCKSKYNQFCYITHNMLSLVLTLLPRWCLVPRPHHPPPGNEASVVPAYSSEIAGLNSKDLVLQLPKTLTDITQHYVDFVRCEQHETALKVKEYMQ